MGKPREAPLAKLFAAVLHRAQFDPEPVLERLAARYGPIDLRSTPFAFDGSRYYESEMGPGLVKFFVSFTALVPQQFLADVKLETNELEAQAADARGRTCNLDPGIVTHYSVILATTKGYAHRVYLGKGIYAEPALIFRRGGVEPLPWTYPDYQPAVAGDFFKKVRSFLMARAANRDCGLRERIEEM